MVCGVLEVSVDLVVVCDDVDGADCCALWLVVVLELDVFGDVCATADVASATAAVVIKSRRFFIGNLLNVGAFQPRTR